MVPDWIMVWSQLEFCDTGIIYWRSVNDWKSLFVKISLKMQGYFPYLHFRLGDYKLDNFCFWWYIAYNAFWQKAHIGPYRASRKVASVWNDIYRKYELLIKDLFANVFIPFLLNDYEMIHIIDLHYFKESVNNYILDNQINDLLFL